MCHLPSVGLCCLWRKLDIQTARDHDEKPVIRVCKDFLLDPGFPGSLVGSGRITGRITRLILPVTVLRVKLGNSSEAFLESVLEPITESLLVFKFHCYVIFDISIIISKCRDYCLRNHRASVA